MARTPEESEAREVSVTSRMTDAMTAKLDRQRAYRGGMTRSAYIRWLIQQDGKRIAKEQGGL